jgi:hypothetical protein
VLTDVRFGFNDDPARDPLIGSTLENCAEELA